MKKTVTYTNQLGRSITFDNKKPYFIESIDATSMQGVFSTETLAQTIGQITTSRIFTSRTVVCDFALCIEKSEKKQFILDEIIALFNPLVSGTLKIRNTRGSYEIDCYPSAVPKIEKDKNVKTVYRFSVDFICDYPYFREVGIITKKLTETYNTVNSLSVVDTPIIINAPANEAFIFTQRDTKQGFTISGCDKPVTINTTDFSITDSDGNNRSNLISAADDIGDIYLRYGKNNIFCTSTNVTISWYNYVLGVI